ncbi:MAG: VWA domain-containing protein [Verrucomicrobiaceae bacterium]|nr:VWA domain-containing protein [Verrucomicrobiaceae bacterium]
MTRLRLLSSILAVLGLGAASFAAEPDGLREVVKGIRAGDQEALAPLKALFDEKAASLVLDVITSKNVGGGMKARMAEIVANWPVDAPGRKNLLDWLPRHSNADEDTLLFYGKLASKETRPFFETLLLHGDVKREPVRVALSAQALGVWQDVTEPVLTRVRSLLSPTLPHVLRASAAEALGGMRHIESLRALVALVEDEALAAHAARALFRLTGEDFENDSATRWQTWLTEHPRIDWKMHAASEWENYLRTQALLKPAEDVAAEMQAFYGVRLSGKSMLFILDVSGSMETNGRISKLRGQMANMLTVLQNRPATTRYGILTFSDGVTPCFSRGGISSNEEKAHEKAVRFVDRLQADGGTDMVTALRYARERILPAAEVDTIYLLSDGEPSDGSAQDVLDAVRATHQRFQTRFHTISIGEAPPANFGEKSLLEEVAAITGGSFTRVREE